MVCRQAAALFLALLSAAACANGGGGGTDSGGSGDGEGQCAPQSVVLRNGVEMPRLGFGCAALGGRAAASTSAALREGLRLLDSAQAREWYDEPGVGRGLADAVAEGHASREDVFVTSKLHPRHLGAQTAAQVPQSLSDLGVERVDLFLLHYPRCWSGVCGNQRTTDEDLVESWEALSSLVRSGTLRAIGMSNVRVSDLELVRRHCEASGTCELPHVVQNWMDVFHQDREVRRYCSEHGIAYQAYSLLGTQWLARGAYAANPVLTHPAVRRAAAETGLSEAAVLLRWAIMGGALALCRSTKEPHIRDCASVNAALRQLPAEELLPREHFDALNALDGAL